MQPYNVSYTMNEYMYVCISHRSQSSSLEISLFTFSSIVLAKSAGCDTLILFTFL